MNINSKIKLNLRFLAVQWSEHQILKTFFLSIYKTKAFFHNTVMFTWNRTHKHQTNGSNQTNSLGKFSYRLGNKFTYVWKTRSQFTCCLIMCLFFPLINVMTSFPHYHVSYRVIYRIFPCYFFLIALDNFRSTKGSSITCGKK